jgi:hypothetical protein
MNNSLSSLAEYRWDQETQEQYSSTTKVEAKVRTNRVSWQAADASYFDDLTGSTLDESTSPRMTLSPQIAGSGSLTLSSIEPDITPIGPVAFGIADRSRQWAFDGSLDDDYFMYNRANGSAVVQSANTGTLFTFAAPTAGQRILWAADFSGDGQCDILWMDNATGAVSCQILTVVSPNINIAAVRTGSLSTPNRAIIGFGDFNADGSADIVTRTANGTVELTLNSGGTSGSLFSIPGLSSAMAHSSQLEGIADVNGDGREDLIWRDTSGNMVAWLIGNNATVFTTAALPTVGHEWRLETLGRFNNDGKSDFLWRNTATGRTLAWITGGTASTLTQTVTDYGTQTMDMEFYAMQYGAPTSSQGGGSPRILWQRADYGATRYTLDATTGALTGETRLSVNLDNNDFARNRLTQQFEFGPRRMSLTGDFLEPMRTNHHGKLSSTAAGVISVFDASSGALRLLSLGGNVLNLTTPTAVGGGALTPSRNLYAVGTGDFNNDGRANDVLFRDVNTGQFAISTFNGSNYALPVTYSGFGNRNRVIGIGKMTASAGDTIVSISADFGIIRTTFSVSGTTISGQVDTVGTVVGPNMIGQGLADLDGNGRKDIVFRHADTGAVSYYNFDGATYLGQLLINTTPVTLEWDLVGFANLDGDGDDDIIWRHNGNGNVVAWNMQNGGIGSVDYLGTLGFDYRFEGTCDLNADNKIDLVWRDATGRYTGWLMNGFTTTQTVTSSALSFDLQSTGFNQAMMRTM